MSLLLDTGPLYAWYDGSDRWHEASRKLLETETGVLVLPSPVIPEVDYLLGRHLGPLAQQAFYDDLVSLVYSIREVSVPAYQRIAEINESFAGLELGFVDAAVMSLAEETGIGRVATTDRRDFGAVKLAVKLDLLPVMN